MYTKTVNDIKKKKKKLVLEKDLAGFKPVNFVAADCTAFESMKTASLLTLRYFTSPLKVAKPLKFVKKNIYICLERKI